MGKSTKAIGLKYGFRSGLEESVAAQLAEMGAVYSYETMKIAFVQPEKSRKYTPDFILRKKDGGIMLIETKGRFLTADRMKHGYIRNDHPELDLRFVFSNPNTKITKGSNTTYGMWCEKNGYLYAKRTVPVEWLDEVLHI